jgi:3'(2'), 5'-bisphosphate nucleotidase
MQSPAPTAELLALAALAEAAGRAIMEIYHSDFATETKADASPVTAADKRAEDIILAGLARLYPHIPVIAEEAAAAGRIPAAGSAFFLVDPLDGTREFISRNGEFTVNIGLIRNGVPVLGVIFAPALSEMFLGAVGNGAFFKGAAEAAYAPIKARAVPARGLEILASRSHLDAETKAFINAAKPANLVNAGSSLKFCRIAQGQADLYPRFGRTMEWDTAAGHAILSAAGGNVAKPDGSPFTYGKTDFANGAFVARGR